MGCCAPSTRRKSRPRSGGANLGWVLIAEAAFLAFIVVRGWRWLVILRASAPRARLGDATAVTGIGFALNTVSPFKLGELLRIGAIAPRAGIGVGEASATVVVERVLDVLALFVISQAISITPGSVGTYEGFFLLVLSTFGARPAALVTAVAVLSHVGNILILLLAGAVGALWLRVNRPSLPVRLERPVPS